MKLKILKKDFDAAVKQAWSTNTCVVAQALLRKGLDLGVLYDFNTDIDPMLTFDTKFHDPGDEKKPELQALRNSLPITIES